MGFDSTIKTQMGYVMKSLILLCSFLGLSFSSVETLARSTAVPPEIIQKLKTTGLVGLVHGADPERGLYVFTYNVPGDFFKRYEFSLIATSLDQRDLLKTLHRGDRLQVIGPIGPQPTPQPHIHAESITLLERYNPGVESPAGHYERVTELPKDLEGKTEFVAQVHAVVGGGEVVVLEYKETILPLVVKEPEITQDLFRGDLVRVYFEVQASPGRPTHLVLKSQESLGKRPVEMLQRLVDRHDTTLPLEGRLVLFPKSPTINQDVWAIEEDLGYGLARYITLVNFTEQGGKFPELERINKKMRALWDTEPTGVFKGRNKFIQTKIRIRATGRITVFSPNQANSQSNLTAEDIVQIP